MERSGIEELKGKILTKISIIKGDDGDEIVFNTEDGETYRMYHEQDCCEYVTVEDICGSLEDLIGSEILLAEEVTKEAEHDWDHHETWTFYKLATKRGTVTIRWYGASNGYYSERVDFIRVE